MPISTATATELISKYKETGDIAIRNELVVMYSKLVKYIAISTRNLYQKYADTEDIVNEGIISLISAIESFDISRNVKFETYASIKIRGAIIDFIRKQDFIPRRVRQFAKELETAYSALYTKLHREPTIAELSEIMGVPEDKLSKQMGEVAGATTLSFEELLYEDNFELSDESITGEWEAEREIFKAEMRNTLAEAIDTLNEKERQVISLYYYEKLKFTDIAKVLQVTESRVCQIHAKAILKLKYYVNSGINN